MATRRELTLTRGRLGSPFPQFTLYLGVRGGNLHGRFRYWRNVFEFHAGGKLRMLAGVELTHYVPKGELAGEGRRHLVRWNGCLMRGKFSPYQTGQGMGHAKEMIMGDPNYCLNVFQWKDVRLNLPGVEEYDPLLSLVARIREDGRVAADLLIYMDDLRPTWPDTEEC
jgi:hypothetical protein